MDTDSFSFRYEEHFPVFGSSDFLNIDDESQSIEEAASDRNCWEWEVETELNGDVALIPMSSELGMNYLSNSPPIREDFQKIMSDWQHLLNIEIPDIDELTTNMPLSVDEENIPYIADTTLNTNILPSLSPSLHLGVSSNSVQKKANFRDNRPSGKKIDMSAQCYIVEEDESTTIKTEQSDDEEIEDDYSDDDDDEFDEDEDSSNDEDDETDLVQIKTEENVDIEINELCPKLEPQSLEDLEQNLMIGSGNNYTDKENDYIDVNEFCPKLEPPQSVENLEQNFMVDSGHNHTDGENDYVDVDTISNQGTPILEAGDLNSLLEQFEATETTQYFEPAPEPPSDEELFEFQSTPSSAPVVSCSVTSKSQVNRPVHTNVNNEDECDKNKQILNALPQELIMRIKASSKRKMIPVIDPIPAKRRGIKKTQVEIPHVPQDKVEKCMNPESIQLDHDYCCLVTPYPKHPKKDSGFESAEEDEQRNILRNQPTVKGANGKLMVSLLKVNTIRNSVANDNNNKKKRKLNLEEYKKRREGVLRSCDNSQNNSPSNSGRNSPIVIEDENERLVKHQQKLMQMAAEVLKTPAKSACKSTTGTFTSEEFVSPITPLKYFTVPPPPRIPPNNVEVKVLVSIGVNTDSDHMTSKQFDVPVTELEEIKPLLQNATAKISNNSLITSVIENIQNKKKIQDTSVCALDKTYKQTKEQQQHGEDKTIVYLDKNRPSVNTNSVEVQTDIVVEVINRRDKRRRNSSSSCDDNNKSSKQRSSSNDSHYSSSSQSSFSSASRSRSRSPSPRRIYNRKRSPDTDRERIREVEERRIVYVGGISSTMTKETLRRRFLQYGPISNISIHFREYGDNYGFVTFAYKVDAYEAVEHGNDDPTLPRYDLSFGGRRIFCRTHYADLDNVQDEMGYGAGQVEDSFDNLLREAQAKLRKRKSCT